MARVEWKPSVLFAPLPAVLVTCGDLEHPNALTIAWTGVVCSQPPRVYVSIRPERYSHRIISESKEFVINLTTASVAREVDYCGVKSGRDENKLETQKIEIVPSMTVDAPTAVFAPAAMECRVFDVIPLGTHDMFLADVTGVTVEESLLDGAGKLHLEKAGLIAYSHGEYLNLGEPIGSFGWSVRKKPASRKMKK